MPTPMTWHEELLDRLGRLRRAQDTVHLASGAGWFLASALLAGIAAVVLEMAFFLDPDRRTVLALALGAAWCLLLAALIGVPLARHFRILPPTTDEELARVVGSWFPPVRDRLLNQLQLHAETRHAGQPYSTDLIDEAGRQLTRDVRPLEFTDATDRSGLRRSRLILAAVGGLVILLVLILPSSFPAAAHRLAHSTRAFTPPNAVFFTFESESNQILKGSDFRTVIRVKPRPDTAPIDPALPLTFLWKPQDQEMPDRITVRADSPGVFRTTVSNVRTPAAYSALFNGYQSEEHNLVVLDPPVLRSLRVRLDYPRYTGLPPKFHEEFVGDIAALPGTRVTLSGTSSNELDAAEIRFSNGLSRSAEVQGRSFSARFPVTTTSSYLVDLTDTRGLHLADPISYSIVLVEDESPTIDVLQPGRNLDIAEGGILPLLVRIGDDYGFSSLRLAYRLSQSRYERPWGEPRFLTIPLPSSNRTAADVSYPWSLEPLDLVPEDVIEYSLEVFDNDTVRGPKGARSPLFLLRLPSLDEVFADAETSQRLSLDEMQKTLDDAEALKETLDKVEQDMRQNKPLDWQQQKTLEQVSKQYDEIQKSLERVQDDLQQMTSSLEQQDALSAETLEKYLELQELFEQLDSAELQRALQDLHRAMQNVNRQQLQEALQRLTLSEEHFRASIERTITLLKRIQIEQKLDETIRRTDDVRNRQSSLRDLAADSLAPPDREKAAQQQEDLDQSQQELEAAMRELQRRMEEFFAEMPLDRMERANRKLSEQRLSEQMKRSAQQLRAGQNRNAASTQGHIVQQLQSLGDELRAIQQQLLEQQSQYTINALRQAAMNLLELSRQQEELKNESAQSQGTSPGMRRNAQDQARALESLGKVAQNLAQLGQRSFAVTPQMARSIGDALRAMQNALQTLDMRNAQTASRHQSDAMGALNASAIAVQDALASMMQGGAGGGPGGLMQQLQALAGQQQSLNAQTQSMEAAAQAARLAAEQAAIQKSLEQLNQEAQRAQQGERLLGDLEQIAREMGEVVRSLEQENVNPETIDRQERILSRLLDASRSFRERDFEKRRKATTGTPMARTSPPELDDSLLRERDGLRQDLLRALERGYTKEYEELIRKYFDELQRLERERP